jgi:3-oxoacyl-[acyl-carrier-protein] synthase II
VEQTWNALTEGQFIRDHTRITGYQPVELKPGLLAPDTNAARVTSLAKAPSHQAIAASGWTKSLLEDDSTALIVGTSKGPVETWMSAPPGSAYGTKDVSSNVIGLHEIAETLAHELRFGYGPRLTLSAACASGLHALIHAAMLLKSGQAKRALVVAAEASVHPLFVGSFKRLGVLPPEGFGCRPFDQDRAGFLMSECAAAVCLEASEPDHIARPMDRAQNPALRPGYMVRVERFAMGGDATHLTGVDASGATLRRLLARVIDNRPVDLVHAHGTGTPMNDPIELAAIEDLLATNDSPTWLYSHKGALGHSLGAAGLVSIVLNVQSHRRGIVLPNVQTRNPMPARKAVLSRQAANARIKRSIAVATGFGGPTAVVSLVYP